MKTKAELNNIKAEAEALNEKSHELTVEELAQVSGGIGLQPSLDPNVIDPPAEVESDPILS